SGGPVVAGDPALVVISVADIEIAVRPESDCVGRDQLVARDKLVEEGAGGAVVAQDRLDLPGALEMACADIDVVVLRPDDYSPGLVQPAAVLREELVHEGARGGVVAEYVVGPETADQQVAAAAGGGNTPVFELLDGGPGGGPVPLVCRTEPG